jgi:2-polyprenyl-3-methyl-5-hydroxy-6-metoxy-1,4-benzoquinol methylase
MQTPVVEPPFVVREALPALVGDHPGTAGPIRESEAHRRPDTYYTGVRRDVVALIPEGTDSILEVGCAAGGTGQLLRGMGIKRLIGVELLPHYADLARPYYTEVIVGDAEELQLDHLAEGSLDCILYSDVLEHFRDPWAVLRRHVKLLRPGGHVVASIPNVRYYKAVQDLVLMGEWKYGDAGILDRGHLRFFTWKSIERLFRECGLEIVALRKNVRGSHVLRLLNKVLLNRLYPFLVKQYLVLGQRPGTSVKDSALPR